MRCKGKAAGRQAGDKKIHLFIGFSKMNRSEHSSEVLRERVGQNIQVQIRQVGTTESGMGSQ